MHDYPCVCHEELSDIKHIELALEKAWSSMLKEYPEDKNILKIVTLNKNMVNKLKNAIDKIVLNDIGEYE